MGTTDDVQLINRTAKPNAAQKVVVDALVQKLEWTSTQRGLMGDEAVEHR